ncbi:MAG: hypothetical protein M3335_07900 [Actinomycetota bacterium]|nr:hypothetical protein [Actinomycetota bacterium]
MANWEQLKKFVHDNYVVSHDVGKALKLEFIGDGGRTQLMFITYFSLNNGGEGWVTLESPVGKMSEIDLTRALAGAGGVICGGLALWDADPTLVMMKHAVPLENLDINELVRPMQLLAGSADQLEQQLTGEDRF